MRDPRHSPIERSLLRDERGAVYAEAVITLPVFLAILGLLFLVRDSYEAHMKAMAWVRSDSWQYSNASCEGSTSHASFTKRDVTDLFSDAFSAVSDADSAVDTAYHSEDDGDGSDPSQIPILDDLLNSIFGDGFYATSNRVTYDRQAIIGGGQRGSRAKYALACNPPEQTFWDVIMQAICIFIDPIPILGSICD